MDALQFFLMQHARVHSAEVAQTEGGSLADLALKGLTDDQIRLRPRQDLNSLAWIIWHTALPRDIGQCPAFVQASRARELKRLIGPCNK